jgi:hypothetical protein
LPLDQFLRVFERRPIASIGLFAAVAPFRATPLQARLAALAMTCR